MHPIYNSLSGNEKALIRSYFADMFCNEHTVLVEHFVEKLKFKYYQIKIVDAWTYNIEINFIFGNFVYAVVFTYKIDEFSGKIELDDWQINGEEIQHEYVI